MNSSDNSRFRYRPAFSRTATPTLMPFPLNREAQHPLLVLTQTNFRALSPMFCRSHRLQFQRKQNNKMNTTTIKPAPPAAKQATSPQRRLKKGLIAREHRPFIKREGKLIPLTLSELRDNLNHPLVIPISRTCLSRETSSL